MHAKKGFANLALDDNDQAGLAAADSAGIEVQASSTQQQQYGYPGWLAGRLASTSFLHISHGRRRQTDSHILGREKQARHKSKRTRLSVCPSVCPSVHI